MLIRALTPDEPANWPLSVLQPATFTALDGWTSISKTIYRYPAYRFETEDENGVTGLLSLVEVKHPLLGHYLTTSPFGSYGGFAYTSIEARDLLLEKAASLLTERGVEYVNLRFDGGADLTPPAGWVNNPIYATYRMNLLPDSDAMMRSFSSDHRNHIRKSLKKGFQIKFGHLDLLDDAYEGLARSMHELGSPYHSKQYLRTLAENLGSALEFVVLYAPAKGDAPVKGELAGAAVFISLGNTVTNLHANILRSHRSDYAGEFLYWSVIERYAQRGLQVYDIGRSLLGSGNETFKLKWNTQKVPLAYWYKLKPGGELPHMNQKSPRFRLAIATWKRLPAWTVRAMGPFLIRGLA